MEWDHERQRKGCFDLDLKEDHVVEWVDREMEQDHEMEWCHEMQMKGCFDLDLKGDQVAE